MMAPIDVNGFAMCYEQGGEGVPLVYVHGGNTSLLHALHYARRPFAWRWRQDFVDRFHFVWYERRGCYRSSAPDDGYDLETQASDLLTLLDHLAIKHAHLVGMSAGGPIAVIFAATHPERVHSLALVSTSIDLWSPDDPKLALVRAQRAILDQEGTEAAFDRRPAEAEISLDALWEREEATWLGTLDAWNERQQTLAHDAEAMPRAERVRRYAAELRDITAGLDIDLRSYTPQIVAPTLVIHGGADWILPVEGAKALAASIPEAEWRLVAGERHQMIFTNREVRQSVIRFAMHA